MLMHSNVITRIQIVSKVFSRDLLNTKRKFLVPLSIDLVNDNVYTKFGLILSVHSQDIAQKPNSDINQGP